MEDTRIIVWNRETALTFLSLVIASASWISTEHFLMSVAVGLAAHSLFILMYEVCGHRYGWAPLPVTRTLVRDVVLPLHAMVRTLRTVSWSR